MHTRPIRSSLIVLSALATATPFALARGVFDAPNTIVRASSDGSSSVTDSKDQDSDGWNTGLISVASPFSILPEAYAALKSFDVSASASAELKAQTFSNWISLSLRTVAEVDVGDFASGSADAQARFIIEFVVPEAQQLEWEFSQFTNSASIPGRMGLLLVPAGTRGGSAIYDLGDDNDSDPSNDKGLLDPGVYILEFSIFSGVDSGPFSEEDNLGEVNFFLNPVPAPSAVGLLGFGGLLIARRRR